MFWFCSTFPFFCSILHGCCFFLTSDCLFKKKKQTGQNLLVCVHCFRLLSFSRLEICSFYSFLFWNRRHWLFQVWGDLRTLFTKTENSTKILTKITFAKLFGQSKRPNKHFVKVLETHCFILMSFCTQKSLNWFWSHFNLCCR